MDTRSFSLGRRRQGHHLEICFVRGSNSRVYGRVDFRDPPSHTTSSVRDCCQLLLLWKWICLICYGSWRPHGKAFLRRIYLLYTNSHRQLLLISNRLWAFLLLEWPFPRRILLKGLEPLLSYGILHRHTRGRKIPKAIKKAIHGHRSPKLPISSSHTNNLLIEVENNNSHCLVLFLE